MVRVTLELDDEVYAHLKEQAEQAGMSVDELLASMAAAQCEPGGDVSPEFRELIARQSERYKRLFARLGE